MTNLYRVTITGADDNTDPAWMVSASKRYPFVEWGILVSERSEGTRRFPTRGWMEAFAHQANDAGMAVSVHVCGAWVRRLFMGELDWRELPSPVLDVCKRIQINTHAEYHASHVNMAKNILEVQRARQVIFQWDGVNDHIALAMRSLVGNVSALFDTSGGAGRLPGTWPAPSPLLPCGYAGGLGPDNVVEQVAAIDVKTISGYWIDMERRVRTEDDHSLDERAVERVLEQCAPLVRL